MTFAIDLSRFRAMSRERLDATARRVMLEMFRRVILRSPVDTGRFRGNWFLDAPRTDGAPDKAGAATVARIAGEIAGRPAAGVFTLVNALDYAEALEYGRSQQAPAGMVRITAAEFGAVVEDAAR